MFWVEAWYGVEGMAYWVDDRCDGLPLANESENCFPAMTMAVFLLKKKKSRGENKRVI